MTSALRACAIRLQTSCARSIELFKRIAILPPMAAYVTELARAYTVELSAIGRAGVAHAVRQLESRAVDCQMV